MKNKYPNIIGCYYSYDRSYIIQGLVTIEKNLEVWGSEYLHTPIDDIAKILKSFRLTQIWINKHEALIQRLSKSTQEFDFEIQENERELQVLNDIYRSLINKNRLKINDFIDIKNPHHRKALSLILKDSTAKFYGSPSLFEVDKLYTESLKK